MIGKIADKTKFQIDISRIVHRGEERFLLSFPYDISLIQRIKGIEGRKYTKTYKGWHIPYDLSSLQKLIAVNVLFAIKQCDKNDPIFIQFAEKSLLDSESNKPTDSVSKKVDFLIASIAVSHRSLLKDYIDYLYHQEYSWTGITYFAKYTVAYLQGKEKDFTLRCKYNLSASEYQRIKEIFTEFRNQK